MKKLSLLFNVIITLAVMVLYYLHFHHGETGSQMSMPVSASQTVYVNMDTLLNKFTFYKSMKDSFEVKRAKLEEEISSQGSATEESEYKTAQQKAQSGNMTTAEMQATQQNLARKQQEIEGYKEAKDQELGKEYQKLSEQSFLKIRSYLNELNKKYNYQFVFGYTKDGNILFANDSSDITKQVVEGLNK